AIVAQGFHGREAEHVDRAADLVARLADAQPGLAGNEPGEVFAARLEELTGLIEDLRALEPGQWLARQQRSADGALHIVAGGQEYGARWFPGVGIIDDEFFGRLDRVSSNVTSEVHFPNAGLGTMNSKSALKPRVTS